MGKHHRAYLRGQSARRSGKELGTNPYGHATSRQSDNHHHWSKGWRDEDAIIRALSPESGWKIGKETIHCCFAVHDRRPVPCADCTNDTSPTTGIAEYYMVSPAVWNLATIKDGAKILCIGCLEKRLGRELTARDFGDNGSFPVNAMEPRSPRLNLRLGWRAGLPHEVQMGDAMLRADPERYGLGEMYK